jgi:16S rRNA (cytosine967-C5)-methyltransferase
MQDIGPRAARAGVTVTTCETAELGKNPLFDVVVVDAPCSGSGTWRRNPEAKWDLTEQKLQEFSALQRDVLDSAASYVNAGGQIVYMTCSVFARENDAIISEFLATRQDIEVTAPLRLAPTQDHDGFFCQCLRIRN